MFFKKQNCTTCNENKDEVTRLKRSIEDLEHNYKLEKADTENAHKLELKEREFVLKHFKDDELKTLQEKSAKTEKEKAILENENKMLREMIDINGDIIDVKELVTSLIKKLPEINLNSLTVQSK